MDEIRTTCPYCGVGCGVLARREEKAWSACAAMSTIRQTWDACA